jgi:hypothetical protein
MHELKAPEQYILGSDGFDCRADSAAEAASVAKGLYCKR